MLNILHFLCFLRRIKGSLQKLITGLSLTLKRTITSAEIVKGDTVSVWRGSKKQNQKWLWMMCVSRRGGFKCYKVTGHALSLCPKARVHPLWVPWRAQTSFMGNVPDRADNSPFFILSAQPRKSSLAIPSRPLSLLSCLSRYQLVCLNLKSWNLT